MDKEKAKTMLFKVADVIEENNLRFFLSDGACLGAYRNRDFIDWDEDIELYILAEDFVPNFDLLKSRFTKAGFDTKGYKCGQSFRNTVILWSKPCHIEICSTFLIDGERWGSGRRTSLVYPARLFENPKQIEFLGRKFYVPTPVTDYLELTYGPEYMTPMKTFIRPSDSQRDIDENIRLKMEAQKIA